MGKATILRFFSRLAKHNSDPFKQYASEERIDSLRTTPVGDAKLLDLLSKQTAPFVTSPSASITSFGIADCLGLDWLSRSLYNSKNIFVAEGQEWWNQTPTGWWSSFHSDAHLVWARKSISHALQELAPLDVFKSHVVEQVVAKHPAADAQTVLGLMQPMNSGYGVGVNIHKLNFTGGKPADLAAKLVSKVRLRATPVLVNQSA